MARVHILVVRGGYLVGVRPGEAEGYVYGPLVTRLGLAESMAATAIEALRRAGL